jgi:hypothetical protein
MPCHTCKPARACLLPCIDSVEKIARIAIPYMDVPICEWSTIFQLGYQQETTNVCQQWKPSHNPCRRNVLDQGIQHGPVLCKLVYNSEDKGC